MTGLNQNIRFIIPQQTVVFGVPFVYKATPEDNARLRSQNCALFYVRRENSSGGALLSVQFRNKVIGEAQVFNGDTLSHAEADGVTKALSVGFALTGDDGDYIAIDGSRGTRIHAGYELELTVAVGGQTDVDIEAHYGRESGG